MSFEGRVPSFGLRRARLEADRWQFRIVSERESPLPAVPLSQMTEHKPAMVVRGARASRGRAVSRIPAVVLPARHALTGPPLDWVWWCRETAHSASE
jgi:hypothetical protein